MWRVGDGRAATVAGVVCAALAMAACGDGDGVATSPSTAAAPAATAPAATAATTRVAGTVTLWFADASGALRPQERDLPAGADPLLAAMELLAAGPDDPSLLPALPSGARLLGASAADGVATVDFDEAFERAYPPGGAAAELAVVGPVVRTAADASGAARVRILVEGRPPAPQGTQLDFSEPFAPGDLPAP